jgi:sulfur carrier protein
MDVKVNGKWCEFPDGTTVADILDAMGGPRQGVAVALNGTVVRRGSWDSVVVPRGASVDILTAVQGG